jgi:hypothetical protein
MEDALPFFALAAVGCSLALVIWTAGRVWLRAKELERTEPHSLHPDAAADLAAILAQIEARLGHLELSVDATAIEVERVAETQRFAARTLAAGDTAPPVAVASSSAQPTTR